MDYEGAYQRIDTWDGRLFSAAPLTPWQKALVLFLGLMAYYLVVVSFLESPLGEGIYRDAFPFWYELDTVVLVSIILAYTYGSEIYLRRGGLSDVKELETHLADLGTADDTDDLERRLIRRTRLAYAAGGVIGLIYVFAFTGSGAIFSSRTPDRTVLLFLTGRIPNCLRTGRMVHRAWGHDAGPVL